MSADFGETDTIVRQGEQNSAQKTAGSKKEMVFGIVSTLTLSQIFPQDGQAQHEHDAIIRIAIRLWLPEFFPAIFGDWSLEDDLASIDPLDLQRYSQPSYLGAAPYPIRYLNSSLPRKRVRSIWNTFLPKLQFAYHRALSSKRPLYVPLGHREFRLLRFLPQATRHHDAPIRCELVVTTIDAPIELFDAVSYCWGPPMQQQKRIIVNGHEHQVNETLYHILSQFRYTSRLHWIDAICIRQDDLKEKSFQIPLMGEIYTGATTVKIWLGADESDSGYVLDCIRSFYAPEDRHTLFLKGLYEVLKRPWFTRVWVAQELVLASPNAPILMSGTGHCSWQVFANHIRTLMTLNLGKSQAEDMFEPFIGREDHGIAMERLRLLVHELDRRDSLRRLNEPLGTFSVAYLDDLRKHFWNDDAQPLHLTGIFAFTRRLEATNARDRVYGLLALQGHLKHDNRRMDITVDYTKSVSQVFSDTTVSIIELLYPTAYTGMLYNLPVLGENDKFGTESPSWMLDFSFVGSTHADSLDPRYSDRLPYPWKNTPSVSEDGRVLELTASYSDVITNVVEAPPGRIPIEIPRMRPWDVKASSMTVAEYTCYDVAEEERENTKASDLVDFISFLQKVKSMFARAAGRRLHKNTAGSKPLWQLLFAENQRQWDRSGIPEVDYSERFEALTSPIPDFTCHDQVDMAHQLWRFLAPFYAAPLSFFTTGTGICGLCTAGVQIGDEVLVLLRDEQCAEVPFVTRKREDECRSMITVAWVQSDWEQICKPQDPERYRFR